MFVKRILFSIKLFAVLFVFDACVKCTEANLPYYELYKTFAIDYPEGTSLFVGDTFRFDVELNAINFIADNSYSLNIISASLAAKDCPPNGHLGIKNSEIDSISVVSYNDWDSTHLAGSSLNDLVYFKPYWDSDSIDFQLLIDADIPGFEFVEQTRSSFKFETSPALDKEHVFEITYYKSNGEILQNRTTDINWR